MTIEYGEYENVKRKVYGPSFEGSHAVFVPVCEHCGRFVKADDTVEVNPENGLRDQPNATCSKHGRVQMLFEGFFSDSDFE